MRNHQTTHQGEPQTTAHFQRARDLVLRYGWDSVAFQILNPGIAHWFTTDGEAVIGYVEHAGYRVVAGAPICHPSRLAVVVAEFEAEAARAGRHVCYFGVEGHLLRALGWMRGAQSSVLIGAQPVWNPQHWPNILARKSSLRAQVARARNKQVAVSLWSSGHATNHSGLTRCLQEWLQTRGLPPMHFLVEPDTLACLEARRIFVAERNRQLVGFLVASPIPMRNGWLIEQIIRCKGAPNGTSELLLDAAMRDIAGAGATYLTLGLSPLSRRAGLSWGQQPAWLRLLLTWLRAHGKRFYNFDGLDAFKAKILPESWEPIYAMTSEPRFSPRTLYAIAGAFSGMSPLWFLGKGLGRAMGMELQWLTRSLQQYIAERVDSSSRSE